LANTTRRDFLGIPASETAIHAGSTSSPYSPAGNLGVWITDDQRRLAAAPAIAWAEARAGKGTESIVLTREKKHQEVLGFGAAFSDASCYMFNQLSAGARAELFHTLFDPSEMGMNVCRTCIGSADSAATVYSYDEGDVDPDLKRFSIDHDREYILPILREARGVNPDLFLFSSPWSPPGWMKSNRSMLGGCMRHTYMASYANYFLKFLRGYEAEGVPVQAVTVQNEVDADQDGGMPACAWPQDYEADFVTMHLGPLFERSGVKTRIWIIDHNYNLWGRAMGELETPDMLKYTNAVAWHGYAGEPEWINRVQDAFPDVEMYWTEGGPDYTSPGYLNEWANWGQTFTRILRNCCRSISVWNFATNEQGRPYVGVGSSGVGGAMIIDSQTKKISYSGMFWALGHFSKFVRRGARRIGSESMANELYHCAFENPDGSLVAVVTNPGRQRTCDLRVGDQAASVMLPANSVVTLRSSSLQKAVLNDANSLGD
jgi:glucosylceramidase